MRIHHLKELYEIFICRCNIYLILPLSLNFLFFYNPLSLNLDNIHFFFFVIFTLFDIQTYKVTIKILYSNFTCMSLPFEWREEILNGFWDNFTLLLTYFTNSFKIQEVNECKANNETNSFSIIRSFKL